MSKNVKNPAELEQNKQDLKEIKTYLKEHGGKFVNESITSFVKLKGINKIYPNNVQAVYDFNLDIEKHDFVALVGPSGCGKSTTLRMIAGLEEISSGELYIDKTYSNYLPSKDRDIAMVFQSYALYPQMSVYDNIAFGLQIRHLPKDEIQKRVFEAADILDLGKYLDRRPKELSGGQMQRVALGRAIVRQANLFLMDEPLSNLDAKLRVQMRSEIVRIHKEVGATTIYVTHDQVEAMTMANKIVVMNKGFIQQAGKAIDVYNHPNNLFVATFIGSPSMNIIDATYQNDTVSLNDSNISFKICKDFDKKYKEFSTKKLNEFNDMLSNIETITDEEIKRMDSAQIYKKVDESFNLTKNKKHKLLNLFKKKEKKQDIEVERLNNLTSEFTRIRDVYQNNLDNIANIKIGIRPDAFYLNDDFRGKNKSNSFKVTPTLVELLGNEYIIHFSMFNQDIQMKLSGEREISSDDPIEICFDIDKVHIFDVESGMSIN